MSIKKYLLVLVAGFFLSLGVTGILVPQAVDAAFDPYGLVCDNGDAQVANSPTCKNNGSNPISGSRGVVVRAAQLVALATGVVSVIAIIIGGFRYIISSGESQEVSTAKRTILYAVIGLVVALTAQMLIVFVINKL